MHLEKSVVAYYCSKGILGLLMVFGQGNNHNIHHLAALCYSEQVSGYIIIITVLRHFDSLFKYHIADMTMKRSSQRARNGRFACRRRQWLS